MAIGRLVLMLFALVHLSKDGLGQLHGHCQDGLFGYKCRFPCRCKQNEMCDKINGSCVEGCREGFWGPGCQLSNSCFYNDQGQYYKGTKSITINNHTCQNWEGKAPHKHNYNLGHFPDKVFPKNFCRTTPDMTRPWCYTIKPKVRWELCSINNCNCPPGRFGSNCNKECHCKDQGDSCDSMLGMCKSGCAKGWTGCNCQTQSVVISSNHPISTVSQEHHTDESAEIHSSDQTTDAAYRTTGQDTVVSYVTGGLIGAAIMFCVALGLHILLMRHERGKWMKRTTEPTEMTDVPKLHDTVEIQPIPTPKSDYAEIDNAAAPLINIDY